MSYMEEITAIAAANQPHPIGKVHKSRPKALCNLPIDRQGHPVL